MRRAAYIILVLAIFLASCKGVPRYVLGVNKLANVLADMHTAEAIVDNDRRHFDTDSAKIALKQAVFDKHGITQEQFDTSLVWYGHNIGKYNEVYDRTIELLEKRVASAGAMAAQQNMSMAGDSVDVWGGSHFVFLTPLLPNNKIAFDLDSDENMEPGDSYTFRAKVLDRDNVTLKWTMLANYSDSTVEYLTGTSRPLARGWQEMTFYTDSTKHLQRFRGNFYVMDQGADNLWVDSIQLVRKRVSADRYGSRHRQRQSHEYR